MMLRSVTLRDWKAYRHARFEFPPPDGQKNIILIGAPNGFGKTSLFEGLTLGLFGRDGLPLIARAPIAADDDGEGRLQTSYSQLLRETLYRRAIPEGRQTCSVELEFEDDEGDPVVLHRRWHFSSSGHHKPQDDELLIYEGLGRLAVGPPATVIDRGAWYRDFVARSFLPPHLAAFFLFDGERVRQFATREMEAQVRRGIEGLLGLPVLRELQDSLRRYADNRRSQVARPSDTKINELREDISKLEVELSALSRKIEENEAILPRLESERDQLAQDLSSLGGGTQAVLEELIKDEQRLRATVEKKTDELQGLLAGDVALGLSGDALRAATVARLVAEDVREAWEAGRAQGSLGLERFIATLDEAIAKITPAMSTEQRAAVLQQARIAWDALWYPEPKGCAPDYLHTHLQGTIRSQASERLRTVAQRSSGELRDTLRAIRDCAEAAEAKKRERLGLEANAPAAELKQQNLQKVSEEIGRLKQELRTDVNSREAVAGQLATKRQELGRLTEARGKGALPLRRAKRADAISSMIGELIAEAVPSQVEAVAQAMTEAWRAMARKKGLVDRIEITPTCHVRLLNRRGEDVREVQLSAGEEQIFTQALIWAIAKISERDFPFVVDTPLGRLDETHRAGVLRHFTDRPGQVILLSTDTEVVGPFLNVIRSRVIQAYRIEAKVEDGVTVSTPELGYFERI